MPDYKCGPCGTTNPDCYITCNHPVCPDGRDQGIRPYEQAYAREPPASHRNSLWTLVLVAALTALFLTVALWLSGTVLQPHNL